jgi:hypothetical protein
MDDLEQQAETVDSILPHVNGLIAPDRWWFLRRYLGPAARDPEDLRAGLFTGALVAAERIRLIAVAAYHKGSGVRWFEHDPSNPSGRNSWLHALNAKQISAVSPFPDSKSLAFLALTTTNLESLVFWAQSNRKNRGPLYGGLELG